MKGLILILLTSVLIIMTSCESTATQPFPPPTTTKTVTVTTTVPASQTSTPPQTTTSLSTPNLTPAPTTAPTTFSITSIAELAQFLTTNYGTCQTSLGPTKFTFDILENDSIIFPYDYWIQVEYDFEFFYELQYSIKITTEMNHKVCEELKNHQEKLAKAVIALMPTKKFYGGYYDSWYKYPELRLELITRYYYSWVNYTPASGLANYDKTRVSEFQWYSLIDYQLTR